jgi:drug/metabolite transporter (DMT)-like permease
MDIYFSFQAALCFSIAHILIRRGLVESNAMTGSFISLFMTAGLLWLVVPIFVRLEELWQVAVFFFIAAGIFAPGIGRTLSYFGIEKIGVARAVPIVNSSQSLLRCLPSFSWAKIGRCKTLPALCW